MSVKFNASSAVLDWKFSGSYDNSYVDISVIITAGSQCK